MPLHLKRGNFLVFSFDLKKSNFLFSKLADGKDGCITKATTGKKTPLIFIAVAQKTK